MRAAWFGTISKSYRRLIANFLTRKIHAQTFRFTEALMLIVFNILLPHKCVCMGHFVMEGWLECEFWMKFILWNRFWKLNDSSFFTKKKIKWWSLLQFFQATCNWISRKLSFYAHNEPIWFSCIWLEAD